MMIGGFSDLVSIDIYTSGSQLVFDDMLIEFSTNCTGSTRDMPLPPVSNGEDPAAPPK